MSHCFTSFLSVLTVHNDFETIPRIKISRDPELAELTRNQQIWCMFLRLKYCTRTQCWCILLTCKSFQRYLSFKIWKGLFYLNDYKNDDRVFVVSDPELPDSLYLTLKKCVAYLTFLLPIWLLCSPFDLRPIWLVAYLTWYRAININVSDYVGS